MKLHRFYIDVNSLSGEVEITDKNLLWQWNKVLKFSSPDKIILFNGDGIDHTYRLTEVNIKSAKLKAISKENVASPAQKIYLFWSLLKRDNNEWILQKCTELGVRNFVPVISDRTIKKEFNMERARKIIIEACEQSGRSEIPIVSKPIKVQTAINEYINDLDLVVAHQSGAETNKSIVGLKNPSGIFIGPEGGWTDQEMALFEKHKIKKLEISQFTLRAETAAIVAASKLL